MARGDQGGQAVTGERPRRVRVVPGGPVLVPGPIQIESPGGEVVDSDRFLVAICTCRRSKIYPLCDTSHRCKRRAEAGQVNGRVSED